MQVSCQSVAPVVSQTYPIYQQNGFPNPSPNSPNEFTPYHQAFKTQNPSLLPDTYPSIIRQVLLNKFLSNQPTQPNLDPNLRSYGLNLDGCQNNQIVPNLLNKYLTSAPCLNTNDARREKIDGNNTKESSKRSRKKSSRKKRKHESKDTTQISQNIVKDKDSQINSEPHTNAKRTSRKHKTHNAEPEIKDKEDSNSGRSRRRKHKEDKTIENQPNVEVNTSENEKPKKKRRHKRPKQYVEDTDRVAEEKLTLRDRKEDFNLAQSSGTKEENRYVRNSQLEANGTKTSAKVQESVAAAYPSNIPMFNSPMMSKIFPNYGQFYQYLTNNMTLNEKRPANTDPRKPTRKRTNRRRNKQSNKNSTQTNPKINVKVEAVTTTDTIQMTINSNKSEESLKSIEETKVSEESEIVSPDEDTGHIEDANENVNNPYEGYFDDYYPQFTDNANNKENYIKAIDNDKYYYATDEEIKNSDILPERKIKDYEISKQYDDIEERLLKIEDSDNEIEFKTPPTLEKPDFETRPITKSEMRPEIYYKKEESHRYVGDKSIEIKQKANFKPAKELETVYAKPKVVKYGAKINSEERIKGDWSDSVTFDGLTYVFAKPMEYSQEEW